MKRYIANIITSCRILFSIFMLFFTVFSSGFFVMYLICGFTDMIDGTIARKTNAVSTFGARLDSLADFVFIACALIKILPAIDIPLWLWIWIVVISIIKIINVISGLICRKRVVVEHTIMNKMVGFLLFVLPFTRLYIELKYSAVLVCTLATFAAIQEGHYIRTGIEV